MQDESQESKIGVRIIVSNLDIAHYVSKAINNIQLENDYNIIISSIIPTVDRSIVRKVATGGDIILIGGYGNDENYNFLFNDLKTDFNHVGLFNYNNITDEDESFDYNLIYKEILNSIIRSTLSYSLNLINIHTLENKLIEVKHNYNNLLDDYNEIIREHETTSSQNKELQREIDEVKADFKAFKLRYDDIYSKDILEIFNLEQLWQETFHQELNDEARIIQATNKFKPDNIIIGQGYIAAESHKKAVEWLNIVRTALIFVDDENDADESSEFDEEYGDTNNYGNFWD